MEASQAGPAAGGSGQAQGDGGGEGEAQAPDVGALAQQLEALQGGQEELRQFLVSQPWQQQEPQEGDPAEGEPDPADFDLSFLDPADAEFNPAQVAERLSGLIDQVTDRRIQDAMKPVNDRLDDQRREREALALAGEFPELEDQQVATEVVSAARQIAEAYGQPELAKEPWFWRMTFMAGRAAEHANEEGAESPQAAHLEGGGGARPAGGDQDLGDAIVSARRGRSVLPY